MGRREALPTPVTVAREVIAQHEARTPRRHGARKHRALRWADINSVMLLGRAEERAAAALAAEYRGMGIDPSLADLIMERTS